MLARGPWDEMHDHLRALIDESSRRDESQPCTECERPIGKTGRWHSDGTGTLVPYCKSCAEIEFPVL